MGRAHVNIASLLILLTYLLNSGLYAVSVRSALYGLWIIQKIIGLQKPFQNDMVMWKSRLQVGIRQICWAAACWLSATRVLADGDRRCGNLRYRRSTSILRTMSTSVVQPRGAATCAPGNIALTCRRCRRSLYNFRRQFPAVRRRRAPVDGRHRTVQVSCGLRAAAAVVTCASRIIRTNWRHRVQVPV